MLNSLNYQPSSRQNLNQINQNYPQQNPGNIQQNYIGHSRQLQNHKYSGNINQLSQSDVSSGGVSNILSNSKKVNNISGVIAQALNGGFDQQSQGNNNYLQYLQYNSDNKSILDHLKQIKLSKKKVRLKRMDNKSISSVNKFVNAKRDDKNLLEDHIVRNEIMERKINKFLIKSSKNPKDFVIPVMNSSFSSFSELSYHGDIAEIIKLELRDQQEKQQRQANHHRSLTPVNKNEIVLGDETSSSFYNNFTPQNKNINQVTISPLGASIKLNTSTQSGKLNQQTFPNIPKPLKQATQQTLNVQNTKHSSQDNKLQALNEILSNKQQKQLNESNNSIIVETQTTPQQQVAQISVKQLENNSFVKNLTPQPNSISGNNVKNHRNSVINLVTKIHNIQQAKKKLLMTRSKNGIQSEMNNNKTINLSFTDDQNERKQSIHLTFLHQQSSSKAINNNSFVMSTNSKREGYQSAKESNKDVIESFEQSPKNEYVRKNTLSTLSRKMGSFFKNKLALKVKPLLKPRNSEKSVTDVSRIDEIKSTKIKKSEQTQSVKVPKINLKNKSLHESKDSIQFSQPKSTISRIAEDDTLQLQLESQQQQIIQNDVLNNQIENIIEELKAQNSDNPELLNALNDQNLLHILDSPSQGNMTNNQIMTNMHSPMNYDNNLQSNFQQYHQNLFKSLKINKEYDQWKEIQKSRDFDDYYFTQKLLKSVKPTKYAYENLPFLKERSFQPQMVDQNFTQINEYGFQKPNNFMNQERFSLSPSQGHRRGLSQNQQPKQLQRTNLKIPNFQNGLLNAQQTYKIRNEEDVLNLVLKLQASGSHIIDQIMNQVKNDNNHNALGISQLNQNGAQFSQSPILPFMKDLYNQQQSNRYN
eukprot:403365578